MRNKTMLAGAMALALATMPAFANHHEGSVQDCWKPAFLAGDADAVAACYAEDAVLWLPGAPAMRGRQAIRDGYANFFANFTIVSAELVQGGERRMGDDAASWGSFKITMKAKANGKQVVESGRYTDLARRVDGHWLYVVDHASDDPAP